MRITGRTIGLSCWREDWRDPHAPWRIQLGWGEGSGKEYEPLYRRAAAIELRPWRSWFIWYRDLLTHEHGEPVYQDRIIGIHQWPMLVSKR